jgi:hypothetical protein
MKFARRILPVLILVGVPLTVFLVARAAAPSHHVSRLAVVAEQLRAKLEQSGATDVQCGWTGYANGPTTITCTGKLAGGSVDSLTESDSASVNVAPPISVAPPSG